MKSFLIRTVNIIKVKIIKVNMVKFNIMKVNTIKLILKLKYKFCINMKVYNRI